MFVMSPMQKFISVRKEDAGEYFCRAKNDAGYAECPPQMMEVCKCFTDTHISAANIYYSHYSTSISDQNKQDFIDTNTNQTSNWTEIK